MKKLTPGNRLTCVVLFLALCCPDPGLAQTPKKIPLRPLLTTGTVEQNSYRNDVLGLRFIPPPGLKLGVPELKGKPGTLPLLVTVAAWGEPDTASGSRGTVFYADDLRYYPADRRSTKDYVERVVRYHEKEGFDSVAGKVNVQLGGVAFTRVDFHKSVSYEAVLVRACDLYALVFIFAAYDVEFANGLIAQTRVELDPKESGCGERTSATQPLK